MGFPVRGSEEQEKMFGQQDRKNGLQTSFGMGSNPFGQTQATSANPFQSGSAGSGGGSGTVFGQPSGFGKSQPPLPPGGGGGGGFGFGNQPPLPPGGLTGDPSLPYSSSGNPFATGGTTTFGFGSTTTSGTTFGSGSTTHSARKKISHDKANGNSAFGASAGKHGRLAGGFTGAGATSTGATAFGTPSNVQFGGSFGNNKASDNYAFGSGASSTTFGQPAKSKQQSSGTAFGHSLDKSPATTAFGAPAVRSKKKQGAVPSNITDTTNSNPFSTGGGSTTPFHTAFSGTSDQNNGHAAAFGQPTKKNAFTPNSATKTKFGNDKRKAGGNTTTFGAAAHVEPFGGSQTLEAHMVGGKAKSALSGRRNRVQPSTTQPGEKGDFGQPYPNTRSRKVPGGGSGNESDHPPNMEFPNRNPGHAKSSAVHQLKRNTKASRAPIVEENTTTELSLSTSSAAIDDDVSKAELASAVNLDGLCVDMCSPAERELHIRVDELSIFEKCFPDRPGSERDMIIKRFQRSSADHKLDIPSEIRPPGVLRRTQLYIEQEIMDRDRMGNDPRFNPPRPPEPIELYNFCWDRFRMIRKDFILQNYRGAGGRVHPIVIDVHERVARYHVFSEHDLCEVPSFVAQQNMEQLGQTLKSLNELYDESRKVGDPRYLSPFEAEFRAYFVLCTLDNGRGLDVLKFVKGLPQSIMESPHMKFAMRVFVARHTNDYFQFFSLLRESTCLQACLLFRYIPSVRSTALQRMNRAFRNQPYSLMDIVELLCFDDMDHAYSVCHQHGLEIVDNEDGDDESIMVQFGGEFETEIQLRRNKTPLEIRSSHVYVGNKQGNYLRQDICRGVTEYPPDDYPALSKLIQETEEAERAKLYPDRPPYEDEYSYFVDFTESESLHQADSSTTAMNSASFSARTIGVTDQKYQELEEIARRKAELERKQREALQRLEQLQREKEEKARLEREKKETAEMKAKLEADRKAKAAEEARVQRENEAEAARKQQELEGRLRREQQERLLQKQREQEEQKNRLAEAELAAKRQREAERKRIEELKAKEAEEKQRRLAEIREQEAKRKAAEEFEQRRRQELAAEQERQRREAALEAERQKKLAQERLERKLKLRAKKLVIARLKFRFHLWKKYVRGSRDIPAPVKIDVSRFGITRPYHRPKDAVQWLFRGTNKSTARHGSRRLQSIQSASAAVVSVELSSVESVCSPDDVIELVVSQLEKHVSGGSTLSWKVVIADLLDDDISLFGKWCAAKVGMDNLSQSSDERSYYRVFHSHREATSQDFAICYRYFDGRCIRNHSLGVQQRLLAGTSAIVLPVDFHYIQDSGLRQRWQQRLENMMKALHASSHVTLFVLGFSTIAPSSVVLNAVEKCVRQVQSKFIKQVTHIDFDLALETHTDVNSNILTKFKSMLVNLAEQVTPLPKRMRLGLAEILEGTLDAVMNRYASSMSMQQDICAMFGQLRGDLLSAEVMDIDYPPPEVQHVIVGPPYGWNSPDKRKQIQEVFAALETITIPVETEWVSRERERFCDVYFQKVASFIDRLFQSRADMVTTNDLSTYELKKIIYNLLIPIHQRLVSALPLPSEDSMDDSKPAERLSAVDASTILPWQKIFEEIYGAFFESLGEFTVYVPVGWRPDCVLNIIETYKTQVGKHEQLLVTGTNAIDTENTTSGVGKTTAVSAKALKRSFGVTSISSSLSLSSSSSLQDRRDANELKRLRQEIARERESSAKFQHMLRQELHRWGVDSTAM